ncbi:PREDICTED: inactive polyglycylase TTLL10 [Ceratotherium simum simum]|uniref:Inactive polyglycylase TTLL10 n=1 Tax=Ceratotherium simum simum TaxID=73337 RepID=A0ABM1CI24_CERSS|nr:PREDICTED: inactive polyglycylase TTLL10 [Ceratotherium simum simum]
MSAPLGTRVDKRESGGPPGWTLTCLTFSDILLRIPALSGCKEQLLDDGEATSPDPGAPASPAKTRGLTAALLTASTEAEHGNTRQTVLAGETSPGTDRMQRWPWSCGAPGPTVTTETAASHKQKPKSRTPGGVPPWAGRTCFNHRRGLPNWTQVGAKRGRGREGVGEPAARPEPLTTHPPPDLDDTEAAGPRAALLEKHLLEGEKQLPSPGQGPFFYIGGTNGASIISSYCKNKGWQRIQDSGREDYKLKWCEVKSRDSYCSFREGEQLLYQLPNNRLLTTKIGLLSALRVYSRVLSKINKAALGAQARVLKMEEFFPETYRLDISEERKAFFTLFDDTQMWICKPTASNQGKGIFLLRNQEEVTALQAKIQSIEDDPIYRKMPFRAPQARIVQRYIQNPLLLDGKKFDVRSYLLIACTMPYMVFFGHGYARLTLSLYDPCSSDLGGHLTNQFLQKKSPLYVLLKENTVWSMDHLNRYINDKFRKTKGLPRDWVFTTFTKQMQQIMAHCFLAVKSKLECKLGYFDLIGCDFLIDENFKVWLLEMNSNPALHTNCEVLKEVIPGVVVETLDLAMETFQKSLHSQKMLPLLSQRRFVLLHNGEGDPGRRPGGPRPPPSLRADKPGARRPVPPPPGTRTAPRPGSLPRGPPRSSARTRATAAPSGRPPAPSRDL